MEFIEKYGAEFSVVANPLPSGINTSALVGRVNKTPGSPYYAGIEANVYEIATDLRPVMSQKVYSSTTGAVRFLLDDLDTGFEKLKINIFYSPDDVNQWVQLVYDFSEAATEVYDEIGMRFNHGSTSTEFWYFDDVMGMTDAILNINTGEEITKAVVAYPNPSSGLFSLDTKDIFPLGSTYDIEILDVQGRSVFSRQVIAQREPIAFDLSDQPPGLYFVRLSGHLLHYIKVIKK